MESTIKVTTIHTASERRVRVLGERVACRRIGPTDVRRCAECIYLLRLQRRYVVCIDGEAPDAPEFAW